MNELATVANGQVALQPRGGLAPRVAARKSDDYVATIEARRSRQAPMTREAKVTKMALILSDEMHGFRRLGVGMVGPIQLKLRYQGIVRNVLVEDPVTPGTPVEYDVWDDLGQAYILSGTEGEVRVTPFEGKRIPVRFFRIASRPAIRKEDLFYLRINAVEQAQDETKQAILKQEDARLLVILQAAVTDYATRPDHVVTPNHNITEASGYLTPGSLYSAVAMTDLHELPSARILINPFDFRDMYRWDINQTGWAFKDRIVAGETITSFGEFQIQRSIIVPQAKIFLTPEPNFLGVFPVLYSLDVEENHAVEAFWKGWVFDEMVAMCLSSKNVQIETKRGWLSSTEVQEGDETPGRNGWTRVEAVHQYANSEVIRLRIGEKEVSCTSAHRWLTSDGELLPAGAILASGAKILLDPKGVPEAVERLGDDREDTWCVTTADGTWTFRDTETGMSGITGNSILNPRGIATITKS